MTVVLNDELKDQILEHCLGALPNEACGMLALDGDRVVKVYPMDNEEKSPVSYTVPPQQHFDALTDAESHGWRLGGVFHSHPDGPPRMSATDLARVTDPEWIYLVVSLKGKKPVITGWSDGVGFEV